MALAGYWLEAVFGVSELDFALGVWLVLAMLIAMPFMGAVVFARNTGSARPAVARLSLHVIIGAVLGYIHGSR